MVVAVFSRPRWQNGVVLLLVALGAVLVVVGGCTVFFSVTPDEVQPTMQALRALAEGPDAPSGADYALVVAGWLLTLRGAFLALAGAATLVAAWAVALVFRTVNGDHVDLPLGIRFHPSEQVRGLEARIDTLERLAVGLAENLEEAA